MIVVFSGKLIIPNHPIKLNVFHFYFLNPTDNIPFFRAYN
jgi:hypothetical protein